MVWLNKFSGVNSLAVFIVFYFISNSCCLSWCSWHY